MRKRLILLRHAERPDIPAGEVGNDVLLTSKGMAESYAFGKSWGQEIISLKTSPVPRCIQTALEIAKAINYDTALIEHCSNLGNPGYYISDSTKAWRHWQEKGHSGVNQFLLEAKEEWDGFHDLHRAAQQLRIRILDTLLTSEPGTHVWVTHDTILAAFTSRILDKPLTMDQWPEFLGYLIVELSDDRQLRFSYAQSP